MSGDKGMTPLVIPALTIIKKLPYQAQTCLNTVLPPPTSIHEKVVIPSLKNV
jgi:hypothetical protein